jgi:hypothetical protein
MRASAAGRGICAVVLVALATLLPVPAGAGAAVAPVLEFATSAPLPVHFSAEGGPVVAQMTDLATVLDCEAIVGEGEITGPRSTVSEYRLTRCVAHEGAETEAKCQSAGAASEEIKTGQIEAELVYINQSTRNVGVLLNPHGGSYIAFECGGESAEGIGAFLASVGPVDTPASVFGATLSERDSMQAPDEYEGANGERLQAIPEGKRGVEALAPTGVEATLGIHTGVPVEIKAITSEELEAQRAREAAQREREPHWPATIASTAQQHPEESSPPHAQPPRVSLVRSRVAGGRLLLTLKLSTAGAVTVSGHGLRRTSRTLAAGVHRLSIAIVARSAARDHRRTKVTISLRAASGSVSRALTVRL